MPVDIEREVREFLRCEDSAVGEARRLPYITSELEESESDEFEVHLIKCTGCARWLEINGPTVVLINSMKMIAEIFLSAMSQILKPEKE